MVLPLPTSPWSSRSIRESDCHVGLDLGNRLFLRRRELEGQGGDDLCRQFACAFDAAPGHPALMGADQRKRQLIGQQLVECQALPCRCGRQQISLVLRVMRRLQRFVPTGPGLTAQVVRVEPFRQIGCAGHGFADGLAQDLRRQAGRHRIDRLRPSEWNRPGPAPRCSRDG